MISIEQASQYIREQNEKRTLWEGNDDPEALAAMIKEEAQELVDGIQEAMVTDNVFEVASEIGDVGYLLLRLCDSLGIDLRQAVEMKIIRNSMKYPDHVLSNGRDYAAATQVGKETWQFLGGDAAFSHAYLDYLAHDEDEEVDSRHADKYPITVFEQSEYGAAS